MGLGGGWNGRFAPVGQLKGWNGRFATVAGCAALG